MSLIRFDSLSEDLLGALVVSGWSAGRKVDPGQWVVPLEGEGYRSHPLAEEILAAMGGLSIEPVNPVGPNFSNDEPYNFDPLAAGSGQRGLGTEVEGVLGGDYFPIGEGSVIPACSSKLGGGWLLLAWVGFGSLVPHLKTPWNWRSVRITH
ncbi:SUKH-3 domain-containing protein [Streptomyces sp. NPDC003656]